MSAVEVNKVNPSSGTNLQLGDSGDTITIPAGATFDSSAATNTLPANVVTTDGTQTLTNKSIVATQLTGTITPSDNTVSIAKLTATGTKDATTFLRGDNSFAEAGGGKILQVISDTKTDNFSTTSATPIDVTGLAVAITPSATSSKILVMLTLGSFQSSSEGARAMLILARNLSGTDTSLILGDASTGFETTLTVCTRSTSGTHQQFPASFTFLDSPNTTSECIYKPQVGRGPDAQGNVVVNSSNAQDSNSGNTASTITVMEISA